MANDMIHAHPFIPSASDAARCQTCGETNMIWDHYGFGPNEPLSDPDPAQLLKALKSLREYVRKHGIDHDCPCHVDLPCPIAEAEAAISKAEGK